MFSLELMLKFCLDVPVRKDEDDQQEEDDDNKAENISDEGIEDNDSDSGTIPNDYLISSVSKIDLDLMSMFYFSSKFYFIFFN